MSQLLTPRFRPGLYGSGRRSFLPVQNPAWGEVNAGHNNVEFDSTDYLQTSADGANGLAASFTWAAQVRVASTTHTAGRVIIGYHQPAPTYFYRLQLTTAGQARLNCTTTTETVAFSGTTALAPGVDYVIVATLWWDGGSGGAELWVDGVSEGTGTVTGACAPVTTIDQHLIGAHYDGTLQFGAAGGGQMGFVYGAWATDQSARCTDPSVFGTGTVPVELGADGSTPLGFQPQIFFGGQQVATDWNAGTNLGTVTGWTMNGSGVVDA